MRPKSVRVEAVGVVGFGRFANLVNLQLWAEAGLAQGTAQFVKRADLPTNAAIFGVRRVVPEWKRDVASRVAKADAVKRLIVFCALLFFLLEQSKHIRRFAGDKLRQLEDRYRLRRHRSAPNRRDAQVYDLRSTSYLRPFTWGN